jgi:septal ring factor EnvC (AmiA/AmiB activator)
MNRGGFVGKTVRCLAVVLLLWAAGTDGLMAQSTKKIRELQARREQLQQQIAEQEGVLRTTKKDVKSQMDNLALLNGKIEERRKYIQSIEQDVSELQKESTTLQNQLNELQRDLKKKQTNYEASVQYLYRNKSIQEKLMFIFSADNLSQTYRRLRYVREYADFQRREGLEIERKQKQVNAKKAELDETRRAKEELLKQGEAQKAELEAQEKERKTLLAQLQKKQKGIQGEINKQKKSAQQLNAQIDRLIEIEIEKARKRAEEEARKKAAAEEARKAAHANATKGASSSSKNATSKNSSSKGNTSKGTASNSESKGSTAKPVERYNLNNEDRQLSGNFERNKGILPMPITGPYVIVSHYGQYAVDGLRNVTLDNKGIDIKGKPGAQARAIFDGEVSAIFQYNGLNNVLVRHGNYISVYCNLQTVAVSKGSKVSTRTVLGTIHTDSSGSAVLHFQLRKETAKLNPEAWLGR